jgi:hypothetical protein
VVSETAETNSSTSLTSGARGSERLRVAGMAVVGVVVVKGVSVVLKAGWKLGKAVVRGLSHWAGYAADGAEAVNGSRAAEDTTKVD